MEREARARPRLSPWGA